ncbi:Rhamnolipids biosynthesis 3-oxoacyl-[acyl-carrier-protein] reductase 5 [Colletotrichum chlorophyti]|uniref:Rhamnolipids biosynthesis 3-oxoacyl-[acyl-carrier-protein] reductase 5 n=1 Tax=Colletotrichum chlorophyti TaxID=708187 RepID=A0A1Q8RQX6_9PEZI|nr:Rhamnolipids biosynthesis 3-oxoacyl-[acyl-carrier-protein] reductase 5 [Colletotrichum chlorophyti]
MSGQKTAGAEGNKLFTRDHLFNLSGKVALVTGGGSGIGLMATQALASNGAKVYITGRTREKLDKVVEQYGKNIEGEIIPIEADLTKKEEITKLVKELESHEHCLCILVNNAGISSNTVSVESDSAQDMKASLFDEGKSNFEDWGDVFATNVSATFFTAASLLPLLRKSSERFEGWSSTIINITSISGMVQVSQHHFAYNASKAAAIHVNRMLAKEIASNDLRIRVNSLAPGVFPSEMTAGDSDEQQKSGLDKGKYEGKVPAHRPGKDEDMAGAILFFATNQYLNGQNVAIDGGYTLSAGL